MQQWLTGIFSVLIAATGWHYLFHSRAAEALAVLEAERLNRLRARLRQVAGLLMIGMAVGVYAGFERFDADAEPMAFVTVWLAVMTLMTAIVVLTLIDLRLTWKLKQTLRKPRS